MNAVISGRAGIALVFDDSTVGFIRSGGEDTVTPCRLEDYDHLFGDAGDLQFLEDVEVPVVVERLGQEDAKELCLQLTLVLLDGGFSLSTRRSAAEELEKLLIREEIRAFVESVLYAQPLPESADRQAIPGDAERVRDLVDQIWGDQAEISLVHRAWQMIPLRLFGGEEERTRFRVEAVRRGLFRNMVRARSHGGSIESASLPERPNAQTVLDEWLSVLAGESGGDRPASSSEVKSIAPNRVAEANRRRPITRVSERSEIGFERHARVAATKRDAREKARSVVNRWTIFANAAWIPGSVMTAGDLAMVVQVGSIFGVDLDRTTAGALFTSMGAPLIALKIAHSPLNFIPVLGWAMKAGAAIAVTRSVGEDFLRYFNERSPLPE